MTEQGSEDPANIVVIEHEPERHRFIAKRGEKVLGSARYTIIDGESPAIDFDGTFVDPELRGAGIASLLAERALTDEIVKGRRILASCWFIREYLERNPRLRGV